jgi:HK97 family phage major capsid protein
MPIQSSAIAELGDELKEFTREHATKLDKLTDDLSAVHKQLQDQTTRADALEARLTRQPGTPIANGSFAGELLQNTAVQQRPKSLNRGQSFNFELPTKNTITGISRTVPTYVGVASGPASALRVRSLIPTVGITAGSIVYTRETGFVNNAAPVAEGQPKPQSDLTYANVTAPVETIAHWCKIAKQTYEDLPQLAAELEARLVYGLQVKEEAQLLKGTGTTPQLQGFYTVATPAAVPPAGTTLIDRLRLGVGQLEAAGYQATGVVVSSADWTGAAIVKDTTGQYITVPAGFFPPVVVSPALAAGEWLIGDFTRGSTLYERENATVQVAANNEDDFIKNLYTALAELREVLAIYQTGAFIKNGPLTFEAASATGPAEPAESASGKARR